MIYPIALFILCILQPSSEFSVNVANNVSCRYPEYKAIEGTCDFFELCVDGVWKRKTCPSSHPVFENRDNTCVTPKDYYFNRYGGNICDEGTRIEADSPMSYIQCMDGQDFVKRCCDECFIFDEGDMICERDFQNLNCI